MYDPSFHLVAHPSQNHFQDSYFPTIESTFAKSVVYKGVEYDCHIIDTAGQVMQTNPSTQPKSPRI